MLDPKINYKEKELDHHYFC